MRTGWQEKILIIAAELIRSRERQGFIRTFCQSAGLDMLCIFVRDPDLNILLAAPGFPQTFPRGALWRNFAERCSIEGEACASLPWPKEDRFCEAIGFGNADHVAVVLGNQIPPDLLGALKGVLPLLGSALSGERAFLAQAAHAEAAFLAAREAHDLALSLDQARKRAQEEAAARSRAERALQRELAEHMRAEEALREARNELAKANLELDRRVQERTASLEEALAQMEEFSYSVSHDLRAPLRAMSAYAEVLLEDYAGCLDATATSYLEKIWRSSKRMDKLTHGLLNYSRVARRDLALAPVDVERLIRNVISDHGELQPPTQISIESPLHWVLGHELSLGQAIANLLNNAVKFKAPKVTAQIQIRSEANGGTVRLWFTDNGIGIEPKVQHRLFRVFERIHPDKDIEGTGIGLAMVRKSIEKMGGKVGVVSDGKNGSSFWIELRETARIDPFIEEKEVHSCSPELLDASELSRCDKPGGSNVEPSYIAASSGAS